MVGDEVYRISDDIQKQDAVEQPKIFGFSLPKMPTTRANFEVVAVEQFADSPAANDVNRTPIDLDGADVVSNRQRNALVIRRDRARLSCASEPNQGTRKRRDCESTSEIRSP